MISGTYFIGISSSHLDQHIVSIMPLASTSIEVSKGAKIRNRYN